MTKRTFFCSYFLENFSPLEKFAQGMDNDRDLAIEKQIEK
jgi:hypothetical protein